MQKIIIKIKKLKKYKVIISCVVIIFLVVLDEHKLFPYKLFGSLLITLTFFGIFYFLFILVKWLPSSHLDKSPASTKKVINKNINNNSINANKSNPQYVMSSNISLNFWSGNKGLAFSFWGIFIFGNICFNILTLLFISNETIVLLINMALIVWNVLAVMAVFNSAEIYKVKKIKIGETYMWATSAKVVSVILILSGIGNSFVNK
jgi:hypothetical protein